MARRDPLTLQRTFMNHRRADVRAAVSQRRRSQGHLRAVTATVGVAGVVTAGAVAAILPGSAHAAANSRARSAPAPSAAASSAASASLPAPPPAQRRGARPRPPGIIIIIPAEGQPGRSGGHRPGGPGARRDHRTATVHVRRLLTLPLPGQPACPASRTAADRPPGPGQATGSGGCGTSARAPGPGCGPDGLRRLSGHAACIPNRPLNVSRRGRIGAGQDVQRELRAAP